MLWKYLLGFILQKCFHPRISKPYQSQQTCLNCGARRDFDQWNYKSIGKWHFTV